MMMVMTTYDNDWISTSPRCGPVVLVNPLHRQPVYGFWMPWLLHPVTSINTRQNMYVLMYIQYIYIYAYIHGYAYILCTYIYIYIYVHVDMINMYTCIYIYILDTPRHRECPEMGIRPSTTMFLLLADHRNWKLVESSWQLLFRTKKYVRAYALRFPKGRLKLKAPRVPCKASPFFGG